MAAFQNGTLHIKKKTSVSNADTGWIRIYVSSSGKVNIINENGTADRLIESLEVAEISGGLNTRVSNLESAGYITNSALTPYTLTTTTASISSGLNTRLNTVENNYATKTSPTSGTFNSVIVNSQGVVTSGGSLAYALTSSIPTSATFLTDYDDRYINATGDNVYGGSYVFNANPPTSEVLTIATSPAAKITTDSGSGFTSFMNSGGVNVSNPGGSSQYGISCRVRNLAGTANNIVTKDSDGTLLDSGQTIPTSATFLTDYDNRYVNVTGDTMTGNLAVTLASNGDVSTIVTNSSSGTAGRALLRASNGDLTFGMNAYGSGNTSSAFGQTLANWALLQRLMV
jgi:hypothetical protein